MSFLTVFAFLAVVMAFCLYSIHLQRQAESLALQKRELEIRMDSLDRLRETVELARESLAVQKEAVEVLRAAAPGSDGLTPWPGPTCGPDGVRLSRCLFGCEGKTNAGRFMPNLGGLTSEI